MTSTSTPEPDHQSHQTPRRRTRIPAPRSGHLRPGARSRATDTRGLRAARPTALWPFAEAETLPGTGMLAGWLGRTIVTLVTTYTRAGDRVLLLAPPAPTSPLPRTAGRPGDHHPYAGLTEAVWTATRLGRSVDIATAAPAPGSPSDGTDSMRRQGAESVSGPRLRRLDPLPSTDPDCDPAPLGGRPGSSPRGRFDLIITAVDPRATDWLGHTDWASELTPSGLAAVITHSDVYAGRLRDPLAVVTSTLGNRGLRCIDRIVVLSAPISSHDAGSALGAADMIAERVRGRTPIADTLDPTPLRRAHHDLALFGRQPATAPNAEAAAGMETSDA
jgi:hypothetical protein